MENTQKYNFARLYEAKKEFDSLFSGREYICQGWTEERLNKLESVIKEIQFFRNCTYEEYLEFSTYRRKRELQEQRKR